MGARSTTLAALLALACGGQNEYVAPPPPEVTVAPPERREVTDYLEMTGRVVAIETVEIRARVEGFLQSVEFVEGDFVKEGDVLFVIEPSEYEARVEQADATLDTALASLSLAEATLARHEEARRQRAVSEIEVLERRAELDVAKARLQDAEAQRHQARLDLSYTRVLSPITGRIGRRMVDPGNLVGAGEKTLLATIVRYDPIYAYFNVSERALLAIIDAVDEEGERVGADEVMDEETRRRELEKVPIELGRANDQGYPFSGHLDFADSQLDEDTGTYQFRGVFENPQPIRLFPGIFARGRLPLGEPKSSLLVSERALGFDQSGKYVLVVDEENVAQHRPVVTGALIDGYRVIVEGIGPEDRVITDGILRARPGALVKPVVAGEAPAATATDKG